MDTMIQPLPFDPAALPGLSERLLTSHHSVNYGGAVRRLDAIRSRLAALGVANSAGFELNGLKREELIAGNAVTLHELHFASLGGNGAPMVPAMELALCASFGSVARWRKEFEALGKSLAGGSGWALLVYQPREGRLLNQWAADHSQALAGAIPLLALDMYEHAYQIDFGADASRWIETFMANVNWAGVYQRYQHAVESSSDMLGAGPEDLADVQIIDVRRAAMFDAASDMLPGAHWRDPAAVGEWGPGITADQPVVVYCIYGHEVCRATALRLRALGRNARFLRGGIDGWQKAGLPLEPKRRPS